jgi:hypothetical protein
LQAAFAVLEELHGGNAKRYLLWEVLMIALCAMLSGGESCADMALLGQLKESFLRQFLTMPHGGARLRPEAWCRRPRAEPSA